jgi:hypothetical protein
MMTAARFFDVVSLLDHDDAVRLRQEQRVAHPNKGTASRLVADGGGGIRMMRPTDGHCRLRSCQPLIRSITLAVAADPCLCVPEVSYEQDHQQHKGRCRPAHSLFISVCVYVADSVVRAFSEGEVKSILLLLLRLLWGSAPAGSIMTMASILFRTAA